MSVGDKVTVRPSSDKRATPLLTSNDLLMLSVSLILGINFSVLVVVLQSMTPLAFNGLRFSLATLVMLLILVWRGESFRMARRDVLPTFLLGVVGHTLYQVVFITGMARTTPANAALLMATSPIFVVVYGAVLGIERPNHWTWIGIPLIPRDCAPGRRGRRRQPDTATLLGDLLVLIAAMLWAAYTTGSALLALHPTADHAEHGGRGSAAGDHLHPPVAPRIGARWGRARRACSTRLSLRGTGLPGMVHQRSARQRATAVYSNSRRSSQLVADCVGQGLAPFRSRALGRPVWRVMPTRRAR
jgi:hypothetical protein